MEKGNPLNPFAQHYLEIQALDPTSTQEVIPPVSEPTTVSLAWPVVLVIAFICALIGYMWYAHKRSVQALMVAFVGILMISALSLGVNRISTPQSNTIHADGSPTPASLIINKLSNNGFTFTWKTSEPTSGAVKISNNSSMTDFVMVYTDSSISTDHHIVINSLDPTKTYYAQVLSNSTWFDHNGSPIILVLQE